VTDAIASFAWDLSAIRVLHKTLADEMSREAKVMAGASGTPVVARARRYRPDPETWAGRPIPSGTVIEPEGLTAT
jgi:hypothetical protein